MLNYHEYEKAVYDWLMAKHEDNPQFTFTVRQSAGNGSERDYFIGTIKSNYFATSFWTLPVSFPGSSADCVSLIFNMSKSGYAYYFELNQTQAPHDEQNESALNLIKSLKEPLAKEFNFRRPVQEANKMYTIQVAAPEKLYTDLESMFSDIDSQIDRVIELTDQAIVKEKELNPDFKAHRVTIDEFNSLQDRLEKRLERHQNLLTQILNDLGERVTYTYLANLRMLLGDLKLDVSSEKIYFNYEKGKLIFGIGQRYVFNVSTEGYYTMISKTKTAEYIEEFKTDTKAYLTNYPLSYNLDSYYRELLLAAKEILQVTNKSGYYKFDKKDFRELVFERQAPDKKDSDFPKMPLNQILYGPPGTGKTYHTINKALEIINDKDVKALNWNDRSAVKTLFQKKVDKGQIVFTTFHQSMSYEDFVEGIKPKTVNEQVVYEVEPGIFKSICDKARGAKGNFEDVLDQFKVDVNQGVREKILTIKSKSTSFDIEYRGTNVFYVQPHNSSKQNPWYPVNIDNIRKVFETGNYERIYNATYVREIISYWEKEYKLKKSIGSSEEPYVLIIDEVNRGNVSAIFGELITLIEESKRAGASEALELTLPYSKEKFSIPSNLYIIGTMNTADRSVEALDTALRRRFSFEEMMPKPELLSPQQMLFRLWKKHWKAKWNDSVWLKEDAELCDLLHIQPLSEEKNEIREQLDNLTEVEPSTFDAFVDQETFSIENLLNTINQRIEVLLDRDHQIGHSYFIDVNSLDDLKGVFYDKIIPLLQEYFYGDYAKIGLVLGRGFIKQKSVNANLFASFDSDLASIYEDKQTYQIKDYRTFVNLEPNDTFETAIATLLNQNKNATQAVSV